jgi:hypothetical protein
MQHGRQVDNKDYTQEMDETIQSRNTMFNRYVETWNKTEEGYGLEDLYMKHPKRARNTAAALEMQKKHFQKIGEALVSQNYMVTPEHVLRIVRIGVANSNRGDIYTEWRCTQLHDAVYFVDKTFEKGNADLTRTIAATAGDVLYEKSSPHYGTEYDAVEDNTANDVLKIFTLNSQVHPVVRYSAKLLVGVGDQLSLVGTDDGNGGWISDVLDTDISKSYITYGDPSTAAVINIEFLAAPATGTRIVIEYQWDSEREENFHEFGTVSIRIARDQFNCRPMPMGYSYHDMLEIQLGATGIGNISEMLTSAIGDEHAMRRDEKSFMVARRVALTNGAPVTFDTDFANQGWDNGTAHAQTILQAIRDVGGTVYDDIRRGVMNKIVAGQQAETYLTKHDRYKEDEAQPRVGASYKAGNLAGIDVYVTPSANNTVKSNQMILSYKNPNQEGDIGVVWGVLTELFASLRYPEFVTKGNIATVEDYMVINKKFFRMMELTNLSF